MSEPIITKYCSKCKEFKSISKFYRNRIRKDRLQPWCKPCHKVYQQSPQGKTGAKRYSQSVKGKATIKRYQQSEKCKNYQKQYNQSEKGKISKRRFNQTIKGKLLFKKMALKYPLKRKAHDIINNAIRAGKLPRADTLCCHYCGKQAKDYHHYLGYQPEHWLDVTPICIKCHVETHYGR